MFEKFTDRARKALSLANFEAQKFNQEYIKPEHVLLGLLEERGHGAGVAATILRNRGLDLSKLRLMVAEKIEVGEVSTSGRIPHSSETKDLFVFAIDEARELSHNYVGTEHLLLGLIKLSENHPDSICAQIFVSSDLELQELRNEIIELLRPQNEDSDKPTISSEDAAKFKNQIEAIMFDKMLNHDQKKNKIIKLFCDTLFEIGYADGISLFKISIFCEK